MRKLLKSVLLSFMALLLFSGVALAAWEYLFPTIIADTSSTTRTYYPVFLGYGGQTLIDSNYISASGNNTNMQIVSTDIPYMMATGNVTTVIPSLPSGGVVTASLYTGYSPQQSVFAIITGSGGYVTAADSPSLELGDNWTVAQAGWVDTTAVGGNLTSKTDAIRTYVSSSGGLTSTINRVDTNLSTFTEVDTGGFLTVGTSNVTAVNATSQTDAYVYRDDGANFYNSVNFTFELYTQGEPTNPYGFGGVALTNTVNDISGLAATDLWVAGNARSGAVVWIYLGRGNSIATDTAIVTANTSYYINVVKSTGNDNAYAYIYSNPAMTTLVDTLTIAGVGGGTRYRYVYGFINNNTGVANRYFNGWTKDLDFGEVSVTATGISSAERTITTTMGDNSSLLFTNGAGFGQYVDLTASLAGINLGNENTYTIETWINPVFGNFGTVFSEGSTVSNLRRVLLYYNGATNNITFEHEDDAGTISSLTWTLPTANVWYHVVASRDAVNVFNLYVNGVLRDSNLIAPGVTTLNNAYIGRWVRLAGPLYGWNGYIDDVRVYVGRGMGGAEALTNYNAGVGLIAPSNSSNLRAHWALDKGSGTAIVDSTGNANSGTMTGAAWSTGLILSQFSISVDGTKQDGAYMGTSVPNNSNGLVFMRGVGSDDVMPYTDNITITIDGTQQLYFAPNTMISGTNIPDRSGNSHNGTIVWGSNSGIALSYGEMESFEDFLATSNITGGFNVPTAPIPATWFAAGENVANLPFYDAVSAVAAQTGKPVQTYYAYWIIGIAFGTLLGIAGLTRSALLSYIAMVVVFAFGSSMTIIPAWIVFVMIIVGLAIMYLYKQVAY